MNKILSVRLGRRAFSSDAGACEVRDDLSVMTVPFGYVAIEKLVMTDELTEALAARSAEDGQIPLVVYDESGQEYSIVVATKFAY